MDCHGIYKGIRAAIFIFLLVLIVLPINAPASSLSDGNFLSFRERYLTSSAESDYSTIVSTLLASNTLQLPLILKDADPSKNRNPIADPGGPYEGLINQLIQFDGSGSRDPDGDPLICSWTFENQASGSGVKPVHQYTTPGTYTVTLTVRDGRGGEHSAQTTAKINSSPAPPVNRNPIADPGGPYQGLINQLIQFDGSGSRDPDGDPLTYNWTFENQVSGSGVKPVHQYATPGTYPVNLTVGDGRGGVHSAQTTATINSFAAPTISGFDPTEGPVGTGVTITGTNFDINGLKVRFNGTPAVISNFTPTSINTAAPLGAVTGPITVTTDEGTAVSTPNFTVTLSNNFNLSITPQQVTAAPSSQVTYTVSATGTGNFTNQISLQVSGLPSGFSSLISPKTITAGQSATLYITAGESDPGGPVTLTITGSASVLGGSITRLASTNLVVLIQGATTLVGRVVDTDRIPIQNVTVWVDDTYASTDESGNFVMQNPPTGEKVVLIDGSTASTEQLHYPTIPITMNIISGRTNALPFVPHFHAQKNVNFTAINPAAETIAEDPGLPGLQLRIPPGVDIIGWDGEANTKVSLKKVPIDALPVPPPPPDVQGKSVYMFYFGKMGGGVATVPVPVTAPNDLGLNPGDKAELWYFNESPNPGEAPNDWSFAGIGTVSADGQTISTDPGVGIPRFCCGAIIWAPRNPTGPNINPDSIRGGDPVDLFTGIFIHTKTDLAIPGRIPIVINRTYRTMDTFRGPYGIGTYFSYDWYLLRNGEVVTLIVPPGTRVPFHRKPNGDFVNSNRPAYLGSVVSFNNPGGTGTLRMKDGTIYNFDQFGLLVEQVDRNGNKLKFLREIEGNVNKIIGSDGRTMVSFKILILGRDVVTEMEDLTGRKIKYTYDYSANPGTGRLVSVTDQGGGVTRYEYDLKGRMTAIIDPKGNTAIKNYYDANSRVCRQDQADGGIWKFYYITTDYCRQGPCLSIHWSLDPVHDPCDDPQTSAPIYQTIVKDPKGNIKQYFFNNDGYLKLFKGPYGSMDFNRSDSTNLLLSTSDALKRNVAFNYDLNGNVTSITDSNGNITRFEFEPFYNQMIRMVSPPPFNYTSRYEYDEKGNLVKMINPMNNATLQEYDNLGQLIRRTNPLGHVTAFLYDQNGNPTGMIDPLGNRTERSFDSLSRISSLTNPLGSTTYFTYDDSNRLVEINNALGQATKLNYDANGNLLGVTNFDDTVLVTNNYDSQNRLVSMTDLLGNTEHYQYDANGNLIQFIDRRGMASEFAYDQADRRVRSDFADGSYTIYTYDAGSRLTGVSDSLSGEEAYFYNISDHLIKKASSRGIIAYEYDALGRRISMTPSGQDQISYSYDPMGRPIKIRQGGREVELKYDPLGRRVSLKLPNGVENDNLYDSANQLIKKIYRNNTAVLTEMELQFDGAGNQIVHRGGFRNLPESMVATYEPRSNQMLNFNDQTFLYDKNGNMTAHHKPSGVTTFYWDARNRLQEINGPGIRANYFYDPSGRRIKKETNGETVEYLYDGPDIIQEIKAGKVIYNYLRGTNVDEPLAIAGSNGAYFYLADRLGSIIGLTNESGEMIAEYTYAPFGRTTTSGGNNNSFQFTGRENDGTGLYYYRGRYFNPELHRFLSEDPLRLADNNLYSYVGNNPIKYTDAFGLTKSEKNEAQDNSNAIWWNVFAQEFLKGAYETLLGEVEGVAEQFASGVTFGLWNPKGDMGWAYKGCLKCSQSYWEGRTAGNFAGALMPSLYSWGLEKYWLGNYLEKASAKFSSLTVPLRSSIARKMLAEGARRESIVYSWGLFENYIQFVGLVEGTGTLEQR